ncbi:MAG: protein phosphatase 2C domain-containing protein [Gallionella sp.]|nr:protein phosphatase 2C domain-containing protein [Gallionella sp.]
MNFSIYQASHIGNRKYNQDRAAYAYSSEAVLLLLADGMGGHLHGELAAESTIGFFAEAFERDAQLRIADPEKFLAETMRHAHEFIMAIPHDKTLGKGMPGTTCVAALIQDGTIYSGHVGDSRLYVLRDGAVLARTRDHSMVQQWLDWGMITAEEARVHPQRNRITNCLGGLDTLFYMEPGKPVALQSGDVLLLASDGLWGPFLDEELIKAFAAKPVSGALDSLIALALEREDGKSDNVTGVAMRWGDSETAHDTAQPVCHILEIT